MQSTRGGAVVIGASMAGLLAARVLADRFDQVTVLDRDDLPDGADSRKGVPQGLARAWAAGFGGTGPAGPFPRSHGGSGHGRR